MRNIPPPKPRSAPPATNGTASRNSTRRCRAGGCGCSTPPSCGRSAIGSSIRPGRWSSSYTNGVFDWHARSAGRPELAALQAQRGPMMAQARRRFAAADRDGPGAARLRPRARPARLRRQLRALPRRRRRRRQGLSRISTTTTGCGAARSTPSQQTITHGVRSGDDDGRQGSMPAFGRDGTLKPDQISTVADYVRSLSGLHDRAGRRSRRRRQNLRRQLRRLPWRRRARAIASSARRT